MPKLSEETLSLTKRALEKITFQNTLKDFEQRLFWRLKLTQLGFPPWFVSHVENCHENWNRIIWSLRNRSDSEMRNIAPNETRRILYGLVAFSCHETTDQTEKADMLGSLRRDGYEPVESGLVPRGIRKSGSGAVGASMRKE